MQAKPASIEITGKVQTMIEQQGGLELILDKKEFDPNFVFGNPSPVRSILFSIH